MNQSAVQRCPYCNLVNPPTALRCDCGYDFQQQQMQQSYYRVSTSTFELASLSQRFLGNFIDTLVRYAILVFWAALLGEAGALVGLLFFVAYLPLCEGLTQRSLGKLAMGTRVETASGGQPSFAAILGRNLARLIPFDWLSGLSAEPIFWHDSASGTRVIDLRKKRYLAAQAAPRPEQLRPLMEQLTTPVASATDIDLASPAKGAS